MIVAKSKRNVARSLPRGPVFLEAATLEKSASYTRHDMALLPTPWGLCALVWKHLENNPDSFPSGFIEKPEHARLCRIFAPGLKPQDLRRQLLSRYPGCNEVLGEREGNFHPEIVPTRFPELARFLRAYYTTGVCGGISSDFTITWSMWRHRLDWSPFTPFQQAVLDITAAIPRGQRLTYGEVARKMGKPRAPRASAAFSAPTPGPSSSRVTASSAPTVP